MRRKIGVRCISTNIIIGCVVATLYSFIFIFSLNVFIRWLRSADGSFSLGPALLKTGLMVTGESKLWVGIKDLPTEVQLEMSNTTNIITITQIPNNQYGYRVQLLDTDGSPLKDVVIKGIDDPKTEIRTNAEGIVQFYSSKSSFSGLTYSGFPTHLDASMFPKTMQGYINDTSVVIVNPDISGYYGYDITVTDNNGSILANHPVYSISGKNATVIGTTDSTGHLIMYRTMSSLTLAAKDGTHYIKSSVSGTIGSLKANSLKTDVALCTGTLAVGNTITCMGKSWIVCHRDGNKYYLALSEIASMTKFGSSNTYAGSTLESVASQYESGLNSDIIALYAIDTTVNNVTSKVFAASYEQMDGAFSYFNSDSRRICTYDGSNQWYWTSSPYGSSDVWGVYADGSLGSTYPSNSYGFRPFVCLSL